MSLTKRIFLVSLLLVSGAAYATGNHEHGCERDCQPENGGVVATSTGIGVGIGIAGASSTSTATGGNAASSPSVDNTNSNEQGQTQGQEQGQNQSSESNSASSSDQTQSQSANNEGNTQVTGQSVSFSSTTAVQHRNTPTVVAPSVFASGVCSGTGVSGAVGALGAGISLGGSKLDPSCTVRENARILGGLGYDETAFVYICEQTPGIQQANGGTCTPPAPKAPTTVAVPHADPVPTPVTVEAIKG
jgi:hypothetical protein